MAERTLFSNSTDLTEFAAGQTICTEGEAGDSMFVINAGEVEISINGRVINQLGPGELFGELALIDQGPRSATAVAKTACKLVTLDEKRFMFLIQHNPY